MLPTDALHALSALSLNEKLLIQPTPDKNTSGKAAFELGQKVQGAIQAEVSPGVFKVRVLEQMLQMQLPASLKSGDVIELQVMSLQPRLTFSMVASLNPLSTPEKLSQTSRLLSSLSQLPLPQTTARTTQSEPLWSLAAVPPNVSELAGKLQQSLSQSGLFYEAHQAQWIAGMRTTAQLMQEPQNALTEPQSSLPTSVRSAASDVLGSIPNALQPLVHQQLNALETRQVFWQGEVWPEQAMRWEIHEESPRHQEANGEENTGQWATQIHLELPNLGEISATLRLTNNGLTVSLAASGEQTRALFGASCSQLNATLAERGIQVVNTSVTSHGDS
jgi:flagellar hook-length control protein FliK